MTSSATIFPMIELPYISYPPPLVEQVHSTFLPSRHPHLPGCIVFNLAYPAFQVLIPQDTIQADQMCPLEWFGVPTLVQSEELSTNSDAPAGMSLPHGLDKHVILAATHTHATRRPARGSVTSGGCPPTRGFRHP